MFPHYNQVFLEPFYQAGLDPILQPSCLRPPYDQHCWNLHFPEVEWRNNTVVIMHTQDFLTVKHNRIYELELIEKHFKHNSFRVVVVVWNLGLDAIYQGPLNLVYFPTHSYELLANLTHTQDCWMAKLEVPRRKIWQCLNGVIGDYRPHRRRVYNVLKNLEQGIISFGDEQPLEKWDFKSIRGGIDNHINFQRLAYVYGDCDINIVTETGYEHPGIITEKTLLALLALQIPIVIGHQCIVAQCQQLGFDMFEDIVDITYDQDGNDVRAEQAIKLNIDLLKKGLDRNALLPRLKKNQQYLLREWPDKLKNSYRYTIETVIETLQ